MAASFTHDLGRPGNYRWIKACGGGSLWDLGCYPVDFCRMLIGREPRELFGCQILNSGGVDESFFATLIFPGGDVAQIDCGFKSCSRKRAEVVGTTGKILIEDAWHGEGPARIILHRPGRTERVVSFEDQNSYARQIEAFRSAVLRKSPPEVTPQGSLGNIRTIVALYGAASWA